MKLKWPDRKTWLSQWLTHVCTFHYRLPEDEQPIAEESRFSYRRVRCIFHTPEAESTSLCAALSLVSLLCTKNMKPARTLTEDFSLAPFVQVSECSNIGQKNRNGIEHDEARY